MSKGTYNKRAWLNGDDSPSTGSVVAFEGDIKWHNETIHSMFLEISDCCQSVRLHKSDNDTKEDFIHKMELLNTEIAMFIEHLKKK